MFIDQIINRSKFLLITLSLLLCPFIINAHDKLKLVTILQNENIKNLDNIYDRISQSMLTTEEQRENDAKGHAKWLKNTQVNEEKLREYYTKRISQFISKNINSKNFSDIISNEFSDKSSLSQKERRMLLVLCLEINMYEKGLKLNVGTQSEEMISENFLDYYVDLESHLFQTAPKEFLFIWCNSLGAHNAVYSMWHISLDDSFEAKLLSLPDNGPTYNSFLGRFDDFNAKSKELTFSFDVERKGKVTRIKKIYKLNKDKLILK